MIPTPASTTATRLIVKALSLFLCLLVGPWALQAQTSFRTDRVLLPSSVRPVAPIGTAATTTVPATLARPTLTADEAVAPLHISMVLKMRNFAELQRRVAAGETISRAEMADRFLPLESDYQAVAQFLTTQGLTVAEPGAGHAVVRATGTPDKLQGAFQTSFARVSFRGTEYTSAVDTPSLPPEIESRVSGIHGLQPYLHPHKSAAIKRSTAAAIVDFEPPYTVSDILDAYDISASGLTGAGQQIGVIIDTVPKDTDLTAFWSANNVKQSLSNVTTVNVDNTQLPSPDGEETLDVSWSSGIASGAQIVIYACGDLDNVNDAYSRVLDDLQGGSRPNLHQITMSFGAGEQTDETDSDIQSVNQMFTAITAYGVSLFAASGDDGSNADGDQVVQVLYPASDPNVTGVGGTSLYLDDTTGAISSETAWANGEQGRRDRDDGSSGGGISGYFSRPAWQTGNTVPAGTKRLVPDVSFAANPDTGCYLIFKGSLEQYGGTSWGAPSWAALCALVNQARSEAGLSALSGANPSLYPLLGTKGFHDITSGSNGAYSAGVGFDLVTGLGSPDFDVLLQTLAGNTATIAQSLPVITSSLAASGNTGSAFSYQITAKHNPTGYNASGLPAGLSVNTSTGVISGKTTVSGTFAVTLSATNSGGTGTAKLTLTVVPPKVTTVTLTATVSQVTVGSGAVGEVTISIPTASSSDLYVNYTLKGSATNGTDYSFLSGQARIKAGKTSKIIKIRPQGDLGGAAKKSVKLTLTSGDGYLLGTSSSVKITILNQ